MRKSNREIKELHELEAVLRAARVMRLALSVDDAPYVVPLNFGYEPKGKCPGRIYFHCAREGRKLDMLRSNPSVAFEVETEVAVVEAELPCKWTTRYRSVIGFGRARIVTDDAEKRHGLDILMAHHGAVVQEYDSKGFALAFVVVIEIETMTGKQLHME